jgi:hypothetical protein
MTQIPTFQAEHFFPAGNLLGEGESAALDMGVTDVTGLLWNSKTQLLHWVDIDKAEVHTYVFTTQT